MTLPVSTTGVTLEKNCALIDSKHEIDERGMAISYYPRGESNIQRDKYNSIKRKSSVTAKTMRAFPVNYNPIDDDLRKAGLREKVDVMIYTAMKDWIDLSIDPEIDIDTTRGSIVINNRSYIIKEIGFANHFYDVFLNVTFGLVRR